MAVKKNDKKPSFMADNSARTLHKNLTFTGAEQYKLLRTNISFTLPDQVGCPVIGVTSSMRGEGKSTTAVNLAYALAENGNRVVLIDGDLRIPSVAKKMGLKNAPGVTDLLIGYESHHISAFKSGVLDDWYVIPSGELPPNPSELLGSKKMERLLEALREEFDYIIIDLPPVNIVSDALVISKLITGMVLVVREDYTSKKELEACVRQLKLSNVNVLGCVLNGAKVDRSGYGKYKRYYKYKEYKTKAGD